MSVVIDTCIISLFFSKKGPPKQLTDWLLEQSQPTISVVSVFEIEIGLKAAGLTTPLSLFPELLAGYDIEVIPFTPQLAQIASDQGSKMKMKGRTYSLQDLWIGATAVANSYGLATANLKDFKQWNGLNVTNPLKSQS